MGSKFKESCIIVKKKNSQPLGKNIIRQMQINEIEYLFDQTDILNNLLARAHERI